MSTATHSLTTETSEQERREPRYPAKPGVRVNVQAPPDIVTEEAQVSDISFRGLGLLVENYVEPGTRVIVHMGTQRLETEVRHCTREERHYRVGIVVHRAADKHLFKSAHDWASLLGGNRRQA
jgi:hypothetical protein